jgi:hydrogenase large subunit
MRCEVNVDSNNVIRNAVSTGTMWRGLEVILKGRDPRDAWAFVERICGVCTGCHALTQRARGGRRAGHQDSPRTPT